MKPMTGDLRKLLNPSQVEAVMTLEGPVLALAGAGTGKTRVITYRIVNMLRNWIAPDSVVGLTFTNKAAREMRERVGALVNADAAGKIFLGTFHSFCLRVLKQGIDRLGYGRNFTIANQEDQSAILKQALGETGAAALGVELAACEWAIGNAKNERRPPSSLVDTGIVNAAAIARVYARYQEILKSQNMVDFDDLLCLTMDLWEKHPAVLEEWRERCRYLLVDEFQDTNMVQLELVRTLVGSRANICAVGDDDQSVYGWRGARVDNIFQFAEIFPGAKIVKLEQNYRSTNTILKAANSFIAGKARGERKVLWSDRGDGEPILVVPSPDESAEARYVAGAILEERHRDPKLRFSDFAVLYRSNHLSRVFEREFRQEHVPYRLTGSSFFDRREVRDAVAYLKLLINPRDDQSFCRIIAMPPRGVGPKALETLRDLQARSGRSMLESLAEKDFLDTLSGAAVGAARSFFGVSKKWSEAFREAGGLEKKVRAYFQEIGFLDGFQRVYKNYEEARERQENVLEFIGAIADFSRDNPKGTLSDFTDSFALADDNDRVKDSDKGEDAVRMMTVHAAKGLEFPRVFLVGLEKDLFPHWRSVKEKSEEEERRLFYVAVTRAKDHLTLTHSHSRKQMGETQLREPSPFLAEIPNELVVGPGPKKTASSETVQSAFADFYKKFAADGV